MSYLPRKARRPSPAMVVAIVALVFGLAGGAVAKDQKDKADKDEVTVETSTAGPITTTDPSQEEPELIPLVDFTQRAGEIALVSVNADIDGPAQDVAGCDVLIGVVADTGSGENDLGFELARLARRGDPTIKTADSQALPAPASDTAVSLDAFVTESNPPDEEGNPSEDGTCDEETYEVTFTVSITTLRD